MPMTAAAATAMTTPIGQVTSGGQPCTEAPQATL